MVMLENVLVCMEHTLVNLIRIEVARGSRHYVFNMVYISVGSRKRNLLELYLQLLRKFEKKIKMKKIILKNISQWESPNRGVLNLRGTESNFPVHVHCKIFKIRDENEHLKVWYKRT